MLDHDSIKYPDFYAILHGEKPKRYSIEEYRDGRTILLRLVDLDDANKVNASVIVAEDVPNRAKQNTFPGLGNDAFWMAHNNRAIEIKVAEEILEWGEWYSRKARTWAKSVK